MAALDVGLVVKQDMESIKNTTRYRCAEYAAQVNRATNNSQVGRWGTGPGVVMRQFGMVSFSWCARRIMWACPCCQEIVLGMGSSDNIQFLTPHKFECDPCGQGKGAAQPMRNALDQKKGLQLSNDYRPEEVVAAFRPVEELDMGLVVKIDSDELTEAVDDAMLVLVLLVIGIALVEILVAFFFIKWILHRMERVLMKMVNEVDPCLDCKRLWLQGVSFC